MSKNIAASVNYYRIKCEALAAVERGRIGEAERELTTTDGVGDICWFEIENDPWNTVSDVRAMTRIE
jgi:hypothetical protein